MPKIAASLTAIEVKRLTKPGLKAVGTVPGLMLSISTTNLMSAHGSCGPWWEAVALTWDWAPTLPSLLSAPPPMDGFRPASTP